MPGDVCRDFERSSRLEWLETNHTGAYAMGTVAGVNTRRYHSLLIASFAPPADRYSILPRVEERIVLDWQTYELAAVQYPGTVQPRGFELMEEFGIDPFPRWRYRAGAASVEKTICLIDGRQSVLVRYEASEVCTLEVRLLFSFRDYHSLTRQNGALQNRIAERPGRVSFKPYADLPDLTVFHDGIFGRDGVWYLNHEYLRELDRGLDFREDLYSPGLLTFDIGPRRPAWFIATLEAQSLRAGVDIERILKAEAHRRSFPCKLERALDQFRITRSDGQASLIAGYPWFTDWSRDTLISMPALSAAGFADSESKSIIEMLLAHRSQGVLPNRFLDAGSKPEYNTADATLWLFVAAHQWMKRTHDEQFLRDVLYPAARDILEWHRRGTYHHIQVDPEDHLLSAGTAETQLTWMDAKVGDTPVTPRNGKAVEINALWYNALRIIARWAAALSRHDDEAALDAEAEFVLASFRAKFWNRARGCLYDVITTSACDPRIRPNQLFALSLPFPLLEPAEARQIVRLVEQELITPVGLRTLEPRDPAYQPRFEGPPSQRDAAYHQGAAWPWLIGPFVAAYLYAFGETDESVAHCREIVRRLERELAACCLGSLSEIYDAEQPQRPSGCPVQLWSVAQFILVSQRLNLRPI